MPEQWTNEQWYAWTRQQIEMERRYYEQMYWENLRRQRALQREQEKWSKKLTGMTIIHMMKNAAPLSVD